MPRCNAERAREGERYVVERVLGAAERAISRHQASQAYASSVARAGVPVSLNIERVLVGPGVGESWLYAPVSTELVLTDLAAPCTVARRIFTDAYDAQDYTNTHHNWEDTLTSTAGDVVIHWSSEATFDDGGILIYSVSATQGGNTLLEPTQVRLP